MLALCVERAARGRRRAAAAPSQGLGQPAATARPRARPRTARRGPGVRARGHGGDGRGRRHRSARSARALRPHRQMLRARSAWRRRAHAWAASLATHASGPLRFRYGTGRDLLLGVALRPGRRHAHLGRRQGREVGDGLRRAQAAGRLARHARRPRRGDAAAAPDAAGHALLAGGSALARGRAGRSWPRLLDSPLQPDRAALLDAAGPAPGRADPGPDRAAALDRQRGRGGASSRAGRSRRSRPVTAGAREGIADSAWSALGAAVDAPIRLRLAGEPRRLLDWVAEATRRGRPPGSRRPRSWPSPDTA